MFINIKQQKNKEFNSLYYACIDYKQFGKLSKLDKGEIVRHWF